MIIHNHGSGGKTLFIDSITSETRATDFIAEDRRQAAAVSLERTGCQRFEWQYRIDSNTKGSAQKVQRLLSTFHPK